MKIFEKPIRYIVIHHSGTSPDATPEELEAGDLKKGYEALGFHYLVTSRGRVIPGRPERYQGAHAIGVDDESLGVCLVGTFEDSSPPQAQFQATVLLLEELGRNFGIPPENILAHGDLATVREIAERTSCPGKLLQEMMPTLRSAYTQALQERMEVQGVAIEPTPQGVARISFYSSVRLHNALCELDAPLQVSMVPFDTALPAWSGLLTVEAARFTGVCPIFALAPGAYTLEVRCLAPDQTYNGVTSLLVKHPVHLPCEQKIWIPNIAYQCQIEISSAYSSRDLLFEVRGTVQNTGHVTWEQSDPAHPFRVGFLVFSAEAITTPCLELRWDFSASRIAPGESASFHASINLLEHAAGDYYLLADIVQEQRFWFSSFHSRSAIVPFTVKASPKSIDQASTDRFIEALPLEQSIDGIDSLVYIAPTLPLFDRSAGGDRLIKLFQILVDARVKVTFLYEQLGCFGESERYLSRLAALGVEAHPNPLHFLSQNGGHRYGLCVIGWYELANRILSGVRELLPQTRIVVDSVDLHWVRRARAQELTLSTTTPQEVARQKADELRAYSSADEVWVVSEQEQQKLLSEVPHLKTRIVGIPIERHSKWRERPDGTHVMFLGGFDHPPNESAALRAAQIVRRARLDAGLPLVLDIAGSNPPISVKNLHDGETVIVHGYVPNLDSLFESSCTLLAPLLYGAGLKGKIFEAVSRGIPVLTSSIGLEGTDLKNGADLLVSDTVEDSVEALATIVRSIDAAVALRDSALGTLQARFGYEAISSVLIPAVRPPRVTVAIVTFNQRDLLQRCIKTVLEKTIYPNYQIAVVSNGCADGSYEWLEELQRDQPNVVKVFRNEKNDFFIKPNNFLIDAFPESDIALLNNDVEIVNAAWLTNLVDAAYSAPHVAAAGGRILDSSGVILEAGCEIYSSGAGRQLGHGLPANHASVLAFRSVGYVSGAMLYMRRDAIDLIAPFDVTLHPMYYEDVDWCYRAHLAGRTVVYTPWSLAIHREGSSAGTDINSGMKRYQEINRRKFLEKFRGINIERYNSPG